MQAFDFIPALWFGVILVVFLLIIIEIGFRFGRWLSSRAGEAGLSKHPMEAAVTSALLGLLAFMLGFSFSLAAKRYSDLRALSLSENNEAGTLLLRADLLPEAERESAKSLIEKYVDLRRDFVAERDVSKLDEVALQSKAIQDKLWAQAARLRLETNSSALNLYITSLNELIDLDSERQARAISNRFPDALWLTLLFLLITVATMVGVNSGLQGRRSRVASATLTIAFTFVIVLIIDLDRPFSELVQPHTQTEQ